MPPRFGQHLGRERRKFVCLVQLKVTLDRWERDLNNRLAEIPFQRVGEFVR